MHNKDNNKLNNFIQGLRPFSNSLPKTLKKHLRKSGFNYSSIIDNWTNMVDKKISDYCFPSNIKIDKRIKGGNLVLSVIHGKELETEYAKKEIIDKINSFFGYECISQITLKIVQEKIKSKESKLPKLKNFNKINEKINKINNDQLKNSLNNFLAAYNDREK